MFVPLSLVLCVAALSAPREGCGRNEPGRIGQPTAAPEASESGDDQATEPEDTQDPPPDLSKSLTADGILTDVVSRLPRQPLLISGRLFVRRRKGVILQELRFEMELHWGATPPRAVYTIRDRFGSALEQLTFARPTGRAMDVTYALGDPPATNTPPDLYEPIQDTDLSWVDLSLAFLWWKGGEIVGHDEVRGRRCLVIDVPSPGKPPSEGAASYARVRLWVDERIRMLLQAEGYDRQGEAVRRLWIESLKKVDDRWMIKDMEIQSVPDRRTKLRVDEVEDLS